MRERVEDLGRLAVMIKHICDLEVFEVFEPWRPKDTASYFREQPEERRDEMIHRLAYGLQELSHKLYEALEVAEGIDSLNEQIGAEN